MTFGSLTHSNMFSQILIGIPKGVCCSVAWKLCSQLHQKVEVV